MIGGHYAPRHHPAYELPMTGGDPIDLMVNDITGEAVLRISTTPGIVSIAIVLTPEGVRYFADQVSKAATDAETIATRYALRRLN